MSTDKLLSLVCLFFGEALSVYAEMLAAQPSSDQSHGAGILVGRSAILITLAGLLLLGGYMLGYRSFRSIWVVSVTSITAILIAEPVLSIALFSEMPGRGALIGFSLGALGLLATLVL